MATIWCRAKSFCGLAIACTVASLSLILVTPVQGVSASSTSTAPACQGRDLVGIITGAESGAGNGIWTIAVTNVGASSCRLFGYPRLLGIRGGHEYTLRITSHGTQDGNLSPAVLSPRMSGALILNTTDGCIPGGDLDAASHTYSGVVVLLPGGQGLFRILGRTFYTPCDLSESQLGWTKDFTFLIGS